MKIQKYSIAIVTSIHPDFDSRIWKHALSLAENGYHVHLICPWDLTDYSEINGITFHVFQRVTNRFKRLWQISARVLDRLLPVLKQIDLIHFHDIDLLPIMAVISLKKPVVYDVHENYPEEMLVRDWIPPLMRKPLYYTVLYSQKILSLIVRNVILVVPSQETNFSYKRINRMFLYNFASLSLITKAASDYMEREPSIIFTGSQYYENGSLLLLDIAQQLVVKHKNLKFYLPDRFASDKFRTKFMELVESRDLEKNIIVFPNVKPHELMSVLNRATIAVSPNLREVKQILALPTKIFEYMAASLPIVASNLPNISPFITDSKAGILADPDDPSSFVNAIDKLLADREYSYNLGINGSNSFEGKYSWESQIPKLMLYYENILHPEKEHI
jgi:glycosyltransferase involved in cell wall biosynthesis